MGEVIANYASYIFFAFAYFFMFIMAFLSLIAFCLYHGWPYILGLLGIYFMICATLDIWRIRRQRRREKAEIAKLPPDLQAALKRAEQEFKK